jgi:hypothetical protein
LSHTAQAPPYGSLLLKEEQLTADKAGIEYFTETNRIYYFYYYSIPEQPYT